jgi:nucleoid DNA-binding protein
MAKIQDLSATLIEKYGLSRKDAEQFITQMFALIAEELHSSQTSVKVKGLGTFKVTGVSARESVDVNSGERIVINGHNKITFTPDVVLRDRVNHPFAQFETVVINDGVDFSELDAKTTEDIPAEDVAEIEEREEKEPQTAVGAPVQETLVGADRRDAPLNEPPVVDAPSQETVVGADRRDAPLQENLGGRASSLDSTEQPVADASPLDNNQSVSPIDDEEEETPGGFLHFRCMKICVFSVLAAVLFCCLCFGSYYLYNELQKRNQRIAALEKEVKKVVGANKEVNEKLAQKDSADIIDVKAALANPAGKAKPDSVKPQTTPKTEETTDYNSDARVRTGAYIIIGVDRTVIVQKGQTMESISKAWLGPGMECYVEALNSRKNVAAGDTLKIPKLKLKHRK